MGLKDDLQGEVEAIFSSTWTERDGRVVPEDKDLKLGNDAVNLDATVLYADLSDSTKLVDNFAKYFAAEIYKSFLRCAAKVIRAEGASITAYDGDRVMAVFAGDTKNTQAVRCGLKINWAAKNIVAPAMKKQYPMTEYSLKHTVGIDTSKLFVARAGIRGSNDLVWVGRAANYAAKLCALSDNYSTWITKPVYDTMQDSAKNSSNGDNMWVAHTWNAIGGQRIYGSTYSWVIN